MLLGDDNGYVETDPTGRYGRFNEMLGKGAMKTVYRAFDELNGIEVAWNQAKLCTVMQSPDVLQRMHSEVHLLSTLSHHFIIRFHASWIDVATRTFNFITEMFTSGTLREYRRRYRRVDIRAVKSWARQILHGLVYLHSHDPPVIHRDLKCDNVFVNGHLGQVKIGDLGLAAVLRGSQSAHSVIGTPEFMAPELYEEEYNELVDVYSFGMCVLEMLTNEYPYSECSNPAQIYKKVTSGRLPDAFHKLHDTEARRFIGRCLEKASRRPSAKELLSDAFLQCEDHHGVTPTLTVPAWKPKDDVTAELHCHGAGDEQPTDMTITGNRNPDDDAIYLKVQIADKDGHVRNIYFPFDIISDTPIGVAHEMVKELEITDRDPTAIAGMISREIMNLVPQWKERVYGEDVRHVYEFGEDDEESDPPFHYLSSPNSTQGSVFTAGYFRGINSCRTSEPYHVAEWLQEDDASSVDSGKYSTINYSSGNEQEYCDLSNNQTKPYHDPTNKPSLLHATKESRGIDKLLAAKMQNQCVVVQPPPEPSRIASGRSGKRAVDDRRLLRNRSMVDVRSQLLHRTLVEELAKRSFKTVGSVENIGFKNPYEGSQGSSSKAPGDYKQQVKKWLKR
ncbi:hypothetical protein HPP92_007292 [Vanilla planifolia]|uniref:non-specific serine/threonine protein kinase n=1 Tax=Vanilla planifolia TaxID=51239 RepID=A0A835RFW7_VANPL|nr:hypothetical protein HPP92_007292 [Vanilla planifolia]